MPSSLDRPRACLEIRTRRNPYAAWISFRGEADISNDGELASALSGLRLRDVGSVHLHVAELSFCDANSLNRLCLFADALRLQGRQVSTCGAKPMLRRLACLLDAERRLGLP